MSVMGYVRAASPYVAKKLPERPTTRHPKPTGPDQETVLKVLHRAGGRCEVCGDDCTGERGWEWSIHHRRGRMGSRTDNSLSNLLVVCGSSNVDKDHGRIHQRPSWSRPLGLLLSRNWGPDPAQVAVCIFGETRWVYLAADGSYAEAPKGGE